MTSISELRAALAEAWSAESSATPDEWTPTCPSRGQCDVTSLVVLEYLGGDLQLASVSMGGDVVEHHYWNLLPDGVAVDLTRDQFDHRHRIEPIECVENALIRERMPNARDDLRRRLRLLRTSVSSRLGVPPPDPIPTAEPHATSASSP